MNKHDIIRRKAEHGGRSFGGGNHLVLPTGVKFLGVKEGTIKMDIVPYLVTDPKHPDGVPVGDTWYARPYMMHRDVGVNKERVVCPRSVGKPCPICEEAQKLARNPDKESQELAKRLFPSNRALYNVLDADRQDDPVMVLDCSTFYFGKLLEARVAQAMDERGDFFELVGGSTLVTLWEKNSDKGVKCSSIDFSRREDFDKSLLTEVVNLDVGVLMIQEYGPLAALFNEVAEEEPGAVEQEKVAAEAFPTTPPSGRRRAAAPPVETAPEPTTTSRRRARPQEDVQEAPQEEVAEEPDTTGDDDGVCIACEGTKVNNKGNPCRICNGTGLRNPPDTTTVAPATRRRVAAPTPPVEEPVTARPSRRRAV